MKVYLAGPMRGYPQFNFPAFHAAAARLRELGHGVWSPAERDVQVYGDTLATANPTGDERVAQETHGFSLREALAADLAWICNYAEAVVVLPGWERSMGAQAERAAAMALGLDVLTMADMEDLGTHANL